MSYQSPFRKSRTPKWVKEALAHADEMRKIVEATEALKAAYLQDAKAVKGVQ